jgi:hypothetical protein
MAVAVHALIDGLGAGGIDHLSRVAVGQVHDAPQLALAHAALDGKQHLAQPGGVHANGVGLLEDVARLARGVEDPFVRGQHDGASPLGLGVSAQQGLGLQITDLQAMLEDAHQHFGANGGWTCGIAAMGHPHAAVVTHGALLVSEVGHGQQRQALQMRPLLLKHGLHLAALGAVDARGRPLGLPVLEVSVLLLDGLKALALEGRGLGMADGVLDAAFAVGVTHPGRIGHDLVVRQGGGVHGVEFGLVQVGLEHALLEVVEHHVAA